MRPAEEAAAIADRRTQKQKDTAAKIERARPVLGVLPDSVVGARFGVHASTVAEWRRALGIAAAPKGAGE